MMRFEKVEIQKFRQYEYLVFDFAKNNKEHDLHVIVAENGVGKTNILNAICWCLYGNEPHLGDESKSLPILNLHAKEKSLLLGNEEDTVVVKIHAINDDVKIFFERKMKIGIRVPPTKDFEYKSEFSVLIQEGNEFKCMEGNDAESCVDRYMPKKIRKFFYFDGEQLNNYFVSDETAKIREAIHAISQVDMLTRIKKNLGNIIKDKQNEAGKESPDITNLNTELTKNTSEINNIIKSIEEIKSQLVISERIIKLNTEQLSGQENVPELEASRTKCKAKEKSLSDRRLNKQREIFTFIREMKINLTFYKSAKNTLDIIKHKEANKELPPDIDRIYLKKMLESSHGHCLVCDTQLSETARAHIESLLDKIQLSNEASNCLMRIRNELERIVNGAKKYAEYRERLLTEFREISDELEECKNELQQINDSLSKFENKEQITKLHNERTEHENLLDINRNKKAVEENRLDIAKDLQIKLEGNLKNALEKEEKCKLLNQRIQFASSAKQIIESIEKEMIDEVREKVQTQTFKYFQDLMWKQGDYKRIDLDEQYQLDLIHRDGYSCIGSCSAAERSLLAMSFTLALHQVSGFDSPLFIDTPVSRVSGQNRANFARVLKNVSNVKQLIMAFTTDEYSESISKVFTPIASNNFQLSMNDSNIITSIN